MVGKILLCACLAFLSAAPVLGQIDPKTVLLERAGWEALIAGQPRAAAEAFREAIARDPKNARLYIGAGTAAYADRRDADAKDALEHALQLDPTMTRARVVLGQVLYRSGDLASAIRTYEALVADAPDDRQAVTTLDRWRREIELQHRMQLRVSSHFTVSFEGPAETHLATQALESLERAYWRSGDLLATYPVEPITVVLYTSAQFHDITRAPSWAAGAYDGMIRIPMRDALSNTKELDRVLAHEYVHALVFTLAPRRVPTWLNEGLATALETDDLEWAEALLRAAPAPVPLDALQKSFGGLTGRQAQLAYAASAVAGRRLIQEAGGFAIANLLRDLGDGADFEAAFAHRMQRSFADFQASLAAEER